MDFEGEGVLTFVDSEGEGEREETQRGRGIAAGEGKILIAFVVTLHLMSYVNCYIIIGILQ